MGVRRGEQCPVCQRRLPRSAFPKAELSGGRGRCRDCMAEIECEGCNVYLQPCYFEAGSRLCRTCRGNEQLDRLLCTPKDEVTHFGALRALELEREAEQALLLVCCRRGLHERMLQRRILGFLRVPFVTHQNGFHYCELCDVSFQEAPVSPGQSLRMAVASSEARWEECPGQKLRFQAGEKHDVTEVCRVPCGSWFFRTQARLRGRDGWRPRFLSLWAPVSATEAASWPSPLAEHLSSQSHGDFEAAVASGERLLVSRAALALSKELGEQPSASHSRFTAGLSIECRFCAPADVGRARRLERVRDAEVPAKFLRDFLPGGRGRDLLWLSPEEMLDAAEAYQRKLRKSRALPRDPEPQPSPAWLLHGAHARKGSGDDSGDREDLKYEAHRGR